MDSLLCSHCHIPEEADSKDAVWTWDPEHQLEFDTFKSILSDRDALGIFRIEKDTVVIVDGSRLYGLRWCLVQKQADGSWENLSAIIALFLS